MKRKIHPRQAAKLANRKTVRYYKACNSLDCKVKACNSVNVDDS